MDVYNNLTELPAIKNAVITIGSFDGVHLGHQKILDRIKQLATDINGKSIVITFHPHPRIVLRPDDNATILITSIDEKVALFEAFGVDIVVVVPFTKDFLNQSPDEYIRHFLIKTFQPKYIVIGYDHKFGKNRAGDINFLKKYQLSEGFQVIEIEKQEVEHITISSSKIRKALANGDIMTTNHLLGHAFSISGTVVRGEGIGNTLGFPTANIEPPSKYKLIPREGIYAIRVSYLDKKYDGVLYIGTRPTLESFMNRTIEAHIFDFDKELYGDKLKIEFVDFIRGDLKFESLDELKVQINIDAQIARGILNDQKKTLLIEDKQDDLPKVSAVILNYNGKDWLKKFLPALVASEYRNLEIIVADNGSTDDSLEYLASYFPDISIIKLYQNYGFAKGYNKALKKVDTPYLILLNSDVEVDPGWILPIVELMEKDTTIGACQPKIMAQLDKEYFEYAGAAGGMIDKWGFPFCRGRIFDTLEKDKGQYNKSIEIFWASGAALFIRNQLFQQLEGFDEDYLAHHEEIDLCWRLKRAGYKIMVQPTSVVFHYGGGTLDYGNPRKVYLNFRNSFYSIIKNETAKKLFWLFPLRLVLDGVAGLMFLVKGQFSSFTAILKAHFSVYSSLGRLLKKRKHYNDLIQKVSISPTPNKVGILNKSIIWQYYIRRKKHFKDL
ncbi:MAG: riboflavin kinase/FMN adenylyltransferase [Saprospiraceae bacterium]|jgi:riboflavin kinase/FMN adenylyltransferase